MEQLTSLVDDASTALQLPVDKVYLFCVENKLSRTLSVETIN